MGIGKTLFALEFVRQLPGRRLIISLSSALPVWDDDNDKFYNNQMPIINLGGKSKNSRLNLINDNPDGIFLINYESAWRIPLDSWQWSCVIADEVHRLGHYNSKQSYLLARMLHNTPVKIGMTGTPFHDGLRYVYGICRFLATTPPVGNQKYPRSRHFGSWQDFLDKFCTVKPTSAGVPYITGYRNIKQLADIIRPFTMMIDRRDVVDIPDVVYRVHRPELSGELAKTYRNLARDNAVQVENLVLLPPNKLAQLTRLQQLASCGLLVSDDGNTSELDGIDNKINLLRDLIDTAGNRPVVVFTKYNHDVEIVKRALSGYQISLLTGSCNQLSDWQRGDTQILIANLAAGSTGVRLERADIAVFWSVGYSNLEYEQAVARLARPGQKSKHVVVNILLSRNTIDEDIWRAINSKQSSANKLTEFLS